MHLTPEERKKLIQEAEEIRKAFPRLKGDSPEIKRERLRKKNRYEEIDRLLGAAEAKAEFGDSDAGRLDEPVEAAASAPSKPPEDDAERIRCPYCGEKIRIEAKKCRFCGEWLHRAEPPPLPKRPQIPVTATEPSKQFSIARVLVLFLLVTVIGGVFVASGLFLETDTGEEALSRQTNRYIDSITAKPTPARSTGTWRSVASWRGDGIKNTETFSIPGNEWRIKWRTWPGEYGDMNFQIMIYDNAENLEGIAANVIGRGEDVSYHRGRGDYYLTINSGQNFEVEVEAKY